MRRWRDQWHIWHLSWPWPRRWMRVAGVAMIGLCVVAILLHYAPIYASQPTQPQGKPHPHRVVVPGELPRGLGNAKRLGQQDGATLVQLSIGLRLSNLKAFQTVLDNQKNPHSASYHKYLTPQQFTDTYAPSPAAVNAVERFLKDAGLTVTSVAANRMQIDATGSVAQVEQTFGTTLGAYTLGNRSFYAPDHDPTLPDTIAPYVLNIGGLDTLFHMVPHDEIKPHSGAAPRAGSPAGLGYAPSDLRGAYDVQSLINAISAIPVHGDGSVGVFELAPYIPNDITAYWSYFGVPGSGLFNTSVDGAPVTGDAAGTAEADLDIEVVSALAPGASEYIYTGPNTQQGVNDTYNVMTQSGGNFFAMTTSWGICEPFTSQTELDQLDTYFATAQAMGKTVFAAAGDSGSDDCRSGGDAGFNAPPAVDSPASDPYVIGVGGTSLTLNSGAYGSESTWNDGSTGGGGGGGGLSDAWAQPSGHTGAGTNSPFAVGQREVPDVSADADPNTGYAIYCTSVPDCGGLGWLEIGGTSAAAPLWAGIYNDMNVYKILQPSSPIGAGSAIFYQLFANAQTYSPFHDVTTTTNNVDYTTAPYNADYPAANCYDLASGMGSPDAWNMARDIIGGVKTGGGGPCPATTAAPPTNLIQDGGFEASPSPWQQFSGGQYQLLTTVFPHNGTQSFEACGYANCDDRVAQSFNVPATVNSATLSLWVNGVTTFLYITNNPPCYDHFTVTLATPDGTVFDTVQATCKLDAYGWNLESIPVTEALQAHQGQPVTLTIRGTTSNEAVFPGFYTTWYVDDVALEVS